MADFTPPAEVHVDTTPNQAAMTTSFRDLVLALSAAIGALGFTDVADHIKALAAFAGLAGVVAMMVYRFLHSKAKQTDLAKAAISASNDVATVSPKVQAAVAGK